MNQVVESLQKGENITILSSQKHQQHQRQQQRQDSLGLVVGVTLPNGKHFVVKMMKPSIRQSQKGIMTQSFENERTMNQKIKQDDRYKDLRPFLPTFYGYKEKVRCTIHIRGKPKVYEGPILVYERLGPNLAESLRKDPRRQNPENVQQLFLRLKAIMKALGKSKLCHGDIRVENFILPLSGNIGEIKLFDLDAAEELNDNDPNSYSQDYLQEPVIQTQVVEQNGQYKEITTQRLRTQQQKDLMRLCPKDAINFRSITQQFSNKFKSP